MHCVCVFQMCVPPCHTIFPPAVLKLGSENLFRILNAFTIGPVADEEDIELVLAELDNE